MDTQLQIKANSAQCLLDVFANTLALSVLSLQLIPFLQEVEKCVERFWQQYRSSSSNLM